MDQPNTDLIQGTLDMLILKSLSLEPMHGFGIARRIEQVSRGVFKVNPGSLLTAFQRLERVGWLDSEWRQTENSRRAKFYWLTRSGRKQLDVEMANDLDVFLVQLRVEIRKPVAALVDAANGEVGGIALVLGRVGEAPEMAAVETDLHALWFRIIDKLEIARIAVIDPVRDHAAKLEARRRLRVGGGGGDD